MSKKKIIFFLLLICCFLLIFSIFYLFGGSSVKKVCFERAQKCFQIETVQTPQDMERGLMYREALAEDSGMLFVFPISDYWSFWMKNTLIPLDMIWIGDNNEIVFLAKNVQPCQVENCLSISPDKKAKYVLEINGGQAESFGLELGDKVVLE